MPPPSGSDIYPTQLLQKYCTALTTLDTKLAPFLF